MLKIFSRLLFFATDKLLIFSFNSIFSGTTKSAAAVGVEALISATKSDIVKLGSSMDAPYMYISIAKSETKGATYNAIYGYVLIGSVKQNDELLPQYLVLQFINRSGKDWSYKIDAMSQHVGKLS